ncbi:hypothetical protein D3C71_1154020 [compost metagenome]
MRFGQSPHKPCSKQQHRQQHAHAAPVAPQPATTAIPSPTATRLHWSVLLPPHDIRRERFHRRITLFRRQRTGAHHDGVQVTTQRAHPGAIRACRCAGRRHRLARITATAPAALARQQFGQHRAKTEHITGNTYRLPGLQFRRGIGRGEKLRARLTLTAIEQTRHTEVQQHRFAIGAYQDVGRFEIAMQHQACMRGLHRVADFQEQIEALTQIRFVPRAVHIQRLAMDEFHDQIRVPCRRGAAIVETGDVGMLQPGENAPLRRKTLGHTRAGFTLQEFDRHVLRIQAITAFATEHDTHAAAGQPTA